MAQWTQERKERANELYQDGASLKEIALELGSTDHRVAAAIRSIGGALRGRGAPGWRNGSWKGGRTVDKTGYILLLMTDHPDADKNGYVREHRLVMEKTLGRRLDPKEVVHHKNGKRDDNRPENLEIFPTNGDHLRHELKGRCPNWSPEGLARLEAARNKRKK